MSKPIVEQKRQLLDLASARDLSSLWGGERVISSRRNGLWREVVRLVEKKRVRRRKRRFVVLWWREVVRALKMGFSLEWLLVPEGGAVPQEVQVLVSGLGRKMVGVARSLWQAFSIGEEVQCAAVFRWLPTLVSEPGLGEPALYLVMDRLEKPGNVGALFRSAVLAGVRGCWCVAPCADPLHPHAIRTSTGAVFCVPWWESSPEEVVQWLVSRDVQVVVADPVGEQVYWDVSYGGRVAVVIGREHEGVSAFWREVAHVRVRIPMMHEVVDSLNASVAGALLLYEIRRQWREKGGVSGIV